ncbi:hypothetical protein SteCoe_4969 [Stentor coeruleus]|uniref:Uncharacterized protein n=1 Tax=Stentor coeruleus TaxID=5963 RepID=A0A1R2CTH2_9CILI|nr:hypothetical protein SteCoe_4969 [Stentor coeruleus]
MDENLSIFSATFDKALKPKTHIKLPNIGKKIRNSSLYKNFTPKVYKVKKISTDLIYEKISHSGISSKRSKYLETPEPKLGQTLWKSKNLYFTPKPKHLICTIPDSNIFKQPKPNYNQNYKTTEFCQPVDWKKSLLYTCVVNDLCEFNWENDVDLLSEYQVNEIDDIPNGYVFKDCLKNTVRKLCKELMQNDYVINKITDKQLLIVCRKLFMIRNFTMKIIVKIEKREKILEELKLSPEKSKKEVQDAFMKLTFNIISMIKKWKKFRISATKFIYSGENYMKKIHNDLLQLERSMSKNINC